MWKTAVYLALSVAAAESFGTMTIGGPEGPGGVQVTCDLPLELRKVNIASRGLGCCVFRSLDHAARWQNVPALYGMPEWMKSKGIEGGGYPAKVAKLVPQIAKDRGMPVPELVTYTGKDPRFLEVLLSTGRMPCITYCGRDKHYNGQTIAHMVNLVYLDKDRACILDNNFIGEQELVWMSRGEFIERWVGKGGGWGEGLLAPAAPPVPHLP